MGSARPCLPAILHLSGCSVGMSCHLSCMRLDSSLSAGCCVYMCLVRISHGHQGNECTDCKGWKPGFSKAPSTGTAMASDVGFAGPPPCRCRGDRTACVTARPNVTFDILGVMDVHDKETPEPARRRQKQRGD